MAVLQNIQSIFVTRICVSIASMIYFLYATETRMKWYLRRYHGNQHVDEPRQDHQQQLILTASRKTWVLIRKHWRWQWRTREPGDRWLKPLMFDPNDKHEAWEVFNRYKLLLTYTDKLLNQHRTVYISCLCELHCGPY